MNPMANLNKWANKARKEPYQIEGEPVPSKGKPGRKKKQSAATIVPALPDGETSEALEEQKKQIVACCQEGSPDLHLVYQLMDTTFPLRRREVLLNNARVWELRKEYPPLGNSTGTEVSLPTLFQTVSYL